MTKNEIIEIVKQGIEIANQKAESARNRNSYTEMWYQNGVKEGLEKTLELMELLENETGEQNE